MYDENLKICNHAYAVDCRKEPLKAAPTITKTIITTKHPNSNFHFISTEELIGFTTASTTIATTKTTTASALTILTITQTIPTSSEKTDPCLKKEFGVNPREAVIGLDPKCEENLTVTKKDPLKAAPTTTEIIKTMVIEKTKASEKTDPCLKKGFGVNPRDAVIGLDPNCEENFKAKSETDLTGDFDYIFDERTNIFDKKEPIKAAPTTIETIKTTVTEKTITSEKTDPCLKKGFGIHPRDAVIGLDSNCEESLALSKREPLKAAPTTTEIITTRVTEKTTTPKKTDPAPLKISKSENQPSSPLPPCKLDIRLGYPESDITFDTEKCDPNLFAY